MNFAGQMPQERSRARVRTNRDIRHTVRPLLLAHDSRKDG